MGLFEHWPYTNFHDLNLDWIISKVRNIDDNVKAAADSAERAENAAAEVSRISDLAIVNIAQFVDDLNSATISDAIAAALDAGHSMLYIPAGEFVFNTVIEQDCKIFMSRDTFIESANNQPVIKALGCSFSIYGGNVRSGLNNASRNYVFTPETGVPVALIHVENCHDCEFKNINVPHSKHSDVFIIKNCTNVEFNDLKTYNTLNAVIFIVDHCENVAVRNCYFEECRYALNNYYCYAVYTGSELLSNTFTPPDNIIYENNIVNGSEDSGLDTHGATNVAIRNNKLIDCVCSITAYNDNRRVIRPAGWTMKNVVIENNYCESSKVNDPNAPSPHSFIFVGAANSNKMTDDPTNVGTFDAYENLEIKNNFFKTPNNSGDTIIEFNSVTNNVEIKNNVFEWTGSGSPVWFRLRRCAHAVFENNKANVRGSYRAEQSHIIAANNTNMAYDRVATAAPGWLTVPNGYNAPDNVVTPIIGQGEVTWESNTTKICNSYGVRAAAAYPTAFKTFTCTITNGIAELDSNFLLEGLNVTMLSSGGTSSNCYVQKNIDMNHCIIKGGVNNTLADGSYTGTVRDATYL